MKWRCCNLRKCEKKLGNIDDVGNPNEFTIKELAEKVLSVIPESTSKIIFQKLPQDDPKQRQPDISLAKKELDWTPTVELEEGLRYTIGYFRGCVKEECF